MDGGESRMSQEKNKKAEKRKRKAATAAVAAVTAAGVVAGSVFDSAGDLLQRQEDAAIPAAYVDTLLPDDGGDDDGQDDQDTERYRKRSLKQVMRESILRLPVAVRLTVILPLWLIGQFVIGLVGVVWPAAQPLLQRIAVFALLLLLLFGVFALSAKAAFPHLPLKKLWNRRSLMILLVAAGVLGAADIGMSLAGVELRLIRLVEAGASLVALICAAIPLAKRGPTVQAEDRAKEELPPPAPELTFTDGSGDFTIRTNR